MAVEITDANFEQLVMKSDKPVLVDFWAEWCGPCRMVTPLVEEVAQEFEGRAIVGKVNVDSNPTVSAKFGIRNIPTILFIKGGEVKDKQVGATTKNVLSEKLSKLLESPRDFRGGKDLKPGKNSRAHLQPWRCARLFFRHLSLRSLQNRLSDAVHTCEEMVLAEVPILVFPSGAKMGCRLNRHPIFIILVPCSL